jgi:nucleotide-binding universal stress UspA family protein
MRPAIDERPVEASIDDFPRPVSELKANRLATRWRRRRERPVIAAVDGSDASLAAAGTAARLARTIAAPLIFVYVRTGPPSWLGKPYHQARLNREMSVARRALDASLRVARDEDVDAQTEVLEGNPARRIGEFAEARDARLVVLGARRRRLKNSVSHSVIRDSSRPVVVTSA